MSVLQILLLFASTAIVSTRNVYEVTTSYKYIQSEPYGNEYKTLSETNENRENFNYDCQTEVKRDHTQDDNQNHKDSNGPVFTNVNRHQYNINVKYIKKLDAGIDPDFIIFQDNEDHRRPPYTNKKPENNTKYAITVNTEIPTRKGPSKVDTRGSTKHYTESFTTDRPRTSTNIYNNKTYVSNAGINTVNDTQVTMGIDIDDRIAFDGDKCATGQAKVQGKCVPIQH